MSKSSTILSMPISSGVCWPGFRLRIKRRSMDISNCIQLSVSNNNFWMDMLAVLELSLYVNRSCFITLYSDDQFRIITGNTYCYYVSVLNLTIHLPVNTHRSSISQVDESKPPISVFSFAERKDGQFKIHIMDIYSPRGDGHPPPLKITTEFSFPPEAPLDFPIFEHVSESLCR